MSSSQSQYNYVVTAHKPTNVTHTLVGCFTAPDALNLIISRCTRIEIYTLGAEGLQLLHDVPLYGRVATMELWRPSGREKDTLFISTERYQFCILVRHTATPPSHAYPRGRRPTSAPSRAICTPLAGTPP